MWHICDVTASLGLG